MCLTSRGSESILKLQEGEQAPPNHYDSTLRGLQRVVIGPVVKFDFEDMYLYKSAMGDREELVLYKWRFYHKAWLHIVQNFSDRELTYAQDRLAAIAGTAAAVARLSGMVYMAGLWKEHLGQDLLWQVNRDSEPSLQDMPQHKGFAHIAPSWSWASVLGGIRWEKIKGAYEDTILVDLIQVKGFDSLLSSAGSITLRGSARRVYSYPSNCYMDCPDRHNPPRTSVLVFFICKTDCMNDNPKWMGNVTPNIVTPQPSQVRGIVFTCLVLVPSGWTQTFSGWSKAWRRVGLVRQAISKDEFSLIEMMDVTIV